MSNDTTEWALGMGGWWRRERSVVLRVYTRALPPRDDDKIWVAEIDPRRIDVDLPTLYNSNGQTAEQAKAWCDRWVELLFRYMHA